MFDVTPAQAVVLRHALSRYENDLLHDMERFSKKNRLGTELADTTKAEIAVVKDFLAQLDLEYPIVPDTD